MRISDRFGLAVAGGMSAVLVLVAGCSDGEQGQLASQSAATVTITPAHGAKTAKPDGKVEVKVEDGTLRNVTVKSKGGAVPGKMSSDRTSWTSTRNMMPGTWYTVTATAEHDGKAQTKTSQFSTLEPKGTLQVVDVTPNLKGEKVGVGAPIIVTFNRNVPDKAAVERLLKVKAQKPAAGAWRWIGSNKVIYRTKEFWKAHQQVRLTARLAGAAAGGGVYGVKDVNETITIGAAQIATGDISKHTMTVTRDGKKLKTLPFSAGNGTTREYTTTSGTHLLMGKGNPVTMISPGRKKGDPGYYKTVVDHAVRFSNSGEYTHSAPWSVGSQGSANVSHGCINLSPSRAKWYYDIMQRGDVLKLTGTDRQLEWDNGWGYWQMSFSEWKQGSAIK